MDEENSFGKRIREYNTKPLEEMNQEVQLMSKEERLKLKAVMLKKLTWEYQTLDDFDKGLLKQFALRSLGLAFTGVCVHKLAVSPKIDEILKINFRKTLLGRVLGYKHGIGVFLPITMIAFTDFIEKTLRIGLKHNYITKNL